MCVSVHAHGGARRGGTLFIVEKALLAKEDLPPLVLLNPFFLIQLALSTCAHSVRLKKRLFFKGRLDRRRKCVSGEMRPACLTVNMRS